MSKATSLSVSFGKGDRIDMAISGDSLPDETLNRGPLALLLRRQYRFPSGINIVQFLIFHTSGAGVKTS